MKTLRRYPGRSMTSGFFRDIEMPSHSTDHRAHERFLLDTYADRRADAEPSLMRRVLASLGVQR